jgi:hypothetical protein
MRKTLANGFAEGVMGAINGAISSAKSGSTAFTVAMPSTPLVGNKDMVGFRPTAEAARENFALRGPKIPGQIINPDYMSRMMKKVGVEVGLQHMFKNGINKAFGR